MPDTSVIKALPLDTPGHRGRMYPMLRTHCIAASGNPQDQPVDLRKQVADKRYLEADLVQLVQRLQAMMPDCAIRFDRHGTLFVDNGLTPVEFRSIDCFVRDFLRGKAALLAGEDMLPPLVTP